MDLPEIGTDTVIELYVNLYFTNKKIINKKGGSKGHVVGHVASICAILIKREYLENT